MTSQFFLNEMDMNVVTSAIKACQEDNHIQQVAYSTYHDCLTQVCFTCKIIRTNLKQGEK